MTDKKFDPYEFSQRNIEDVPVFYKNLPWAPCITVNLVFSVGAFSDPDGLEGLAHFLEHMIGAGCPSLPNKKAIKEFNRLYMLNSRNAYTSFYSTKYIGKCLPENFERVVTSLTEQAFEPLLRDVDVINEEKIITQESWGRYKNEKYLNYTKELIQTSYPNHQRSRIASPLGWPETIKKLTGADLKKFHKEKYNKNNFSVFLAGAIQEKDLEVLPKIFKKLPEGPRVNTDMGKIDKPGKSRFEKFADEIGAPAQQLEFTLNRFMEKMSGEERSLGNISMSLIYDILFERLRTEHSLCYGVKTSFSAHKDSTEFGVSVQTSEDKLELVEKEIWSVFSEIINRKWIDRFETIKQLAIERIESAEVLSNDIATYGSGNYISLGKIIPQVEIINEHKKITYDDVVRFVKIVFDKEYIFTEVIFPNKLV